MGWLSPVSAALGREVANGWPSLERDPGVRPGKGERIVVRRLLVVSSALALMLAVLVPAAAGAADGPDRSDRASAPDHVAELQLDRPATSGVGLDAELRAATGTQTVIVRLVGDAVAESPAQTKAARRAQKKAVQAEQAAFVDRASRIAPDAQVLAETQTVLNAVFLEVDAAALAELAADPSVLRISRVADYEMDLSETVPYIGAAAVQAAGYDGSGIKVAVLDSGIDYTHAAFGGSGDPADYAANDPNIIETDTFPTAKVVGGYDFVGSNWPNAPEAPDPDPLDDGPQAGHGTHVGHIIGGVGGVAPAVDLYAVKVCSSVSTSCSGIALIQGMDFAVDPDGDGDPSDAVDVINMSLGSNYGQSFDDDLSVAVDNATALGVLTVASAGNAADKPFIVGTPSATSTALSVAQTQVPSASLQLINVDGVDYPAVFQPWAAPLTGVVTGPVQYGDGAGGNLDGCAPFGGDLTGLVVLIDRGACNFSLKISNVSQAGGAAGIIGLVAPGAPFSGGDGGDRPIDIPGYMISQADSNAIKAAIGNPGTGTIDPANQLPLVGQMVGSSSRGPNFQTFIIKPEIGAPGASVSAIAGTGVDEGPFGGTSGAAPMVSGSAALLLQSEPALSPAESKARLVNTGDTDIDTDPFTGLAPITRIGGGEVRVDNAVNTPLAAWDADNLLPTLSFGHVDVAQSRLTLRKRIRVQNYSDQTMVLDVNPTFRYADDEASGAVAVSVSPSTVRVNAGASKVVEVRLTIDGGLLPGNFMNSGSEGANGASLTANEFDGYVNLEDGGGTSIHVPWQVLPRQAAHVVAAPRNLNFGRGTTTTVNLNNTGVGIAQNDAYSLLGVSPDVPEGDRGGQSPVPDLRAAGVNTFPVPADFCSAEESFIWAFATNTWERQTMAVAAPAYFSWFLDTNQDGIDDYEVFNFDLSLSSGLSDGRNVAWVTDLATGESTAFFFTEQSTVTGNTVMLICGEQIGLTGTDMLNTNVDVTAVVAWDWYFGGGATDVMGPFTITPLGEQYVGSPVDVPGQDQGSMGVTDYGPFPGNTPELGVMVVTNGDRGSGARGGADEATELIVLPTRANAKYAWSVLGG